MAATAPKQDENDRKVVITPIGRASFCHVFEPFAFKAKAGEKQNDPQFSLILVFANGEINGNGKGAKAWTEVRRAVTAAAHAKFGKDEVAAMIKRNKFSLPWRNGIEYEEYGEPFEEGTTFITVKSKNPPGVVDQYSRPIMSQDQFYPGCYARVSCLPWAFDSAGNRGVTLLLNNVQKAAEGEKLAGARRAAEDEFEPLEERTGGDDGDGSDLL